MVDDWEMDGGVGECGACLLRADICLMDVSSGLSFMLFMPTERKTVCV